MQLLIFSFAFQQKGFAQRRSRHFRFPLAGGGLKWTLGYLVASQPSGLAICA